MQPLTTRFWIVTYRLSVLALSIAICVPPPPTHGADKPWSAIPRRLPPAGITVDAGEIERLGQAATLLVRDTAGVVLRNSVADLRPDIDVYLKALRYAVDHGEFFAPEEMAAAFTLLSEARSRWQALLAGRAPWRSQRGLVRRGYRSRLDSSVQPYALAIPKELDLTTPSPLYIYLHGRNEKVTDLQFLASPRGVGRFAPQDAMVLYVFGRYCNAFKAAGEVDVLEAIAHVQSQYLIDPDRIILVGFSMGGAGAWHLGAHYPDKWAAVSPGAGFSETARYQNIDPQTVPWYERTLWNVYDVPSYVRNLFNLPVIAYSGEKDRQIQAARVMEEAYAQEGRQLVHLIGPDTKHKYHPETLSKIHAALHEAAQRGINRHPERVSVQTRTLRYDRCHWVRILGLLTHWKDSRVDAEQTDRSLSVTTRNVGAFTIAASPPSAPLASKRVIVDEQAIDVSSAGAATKVTFERVNATWRVRETAPSGLRKIHGLQGPIDDAFLEPFLVVVPTGESQSPQVERWVQFELAHFRERWRRLFRGDVREKVDRHVTPEDLRQYHLILWGDPQSNETLARVLPDLPLTWEANSVGMKKNGANQDLFAAGHHVPVLIYPNPLAPHRYVVINSGITFRAGHDRTNSLQNPKLPDWAILDLNSPPDTLSAGKVMAAGFFDEQWRVK